MSATLLRQCWLRLCGAFLGGWAGGSLDAPQRFAAESTSAPLGMGLIVPALFGVGNAGHADAWRSSF